MKNYIQYIKENNDAWKFEEEFENFVYKITSWYDEDDDEYYDGLSPNQSYSLVDLIKNNANTGEFTLDFTEEVKDGRSPSFEEDLPLKLNGEIFSYQDITMKITNVSFDKMNDPGDNGAYSRYVKYYYKVKCDITYKK